ncbi:MAG: hypothetical protein Q7S79_01625 [bacterium]|nr:hypothetical protein [bacterium]
MEVNNTKEENRTPAIRDIVAKYARPVLVELDKARVASEENPELAQELTDRLKTLEQAPETEAKAAAERVLETAKELNSKTK